MLPSPTSNRVDTESLGEGDNHPRKRQRIRLSCLECRRRKLSCDRGFPCDRCVKSGTPDLCSYEGKSTPTPLNVKSGIPPGAFSQIQESRRSLSSHVGDAPTYRKDLDVSAARDAARDHDRIRKLELEVTQLKNLLSARVVSTDGSTVVADGSPADQRRDEPPVAGRNEQDEGDPGDPGSPLFPINHINDPMTLDKDELRFFRGKEFKTRYFGPHNACMAFSEVGRHPSQAQLKCMEEILTLPSLPDFPPS